MSHLLYDIVQWNLNLFLTEKAVLRTDVVRRLLLDIVVSEETKKISKSQHLRCKLLTLIETR